MQPLTISLFGGIHIVHPRTESSVRLTRSTQALLAYLLIQQHPIARDVLMDLFWTETPPDKARSNLASAVHRLRRELEPDQALRGVYLLSQPSGEIGFNWGSAHWLDSVSFESQLRPLLCKPVADLRDDDVARMEAALLLYRGDLLEGLYDDWALREQERFRSLYLACLTRLMGFHAGRQAYAQSILYAQQILRKDPLHEETHRALLRLYDAVGQPAQALRQHERFCDLLRREMDLPPLPETDALIQGIRSRLHLRATTPSPAPTPELARLLRELEVAQQSIAELNRLLAGISQAVAALAGGSDAGVTER